MNRNQLDDLAYNWTLFVIYSGGSLSLVPQWANFGMLYAPLSLLRMLEFLAVGVGGRGGEVSRG